MKMNFIFIIRKLVIVGMSKITRLGKILLAELKPLDRDVAATFLHFGKITGDCIATRILIAAVQPFS